ncbi:MAG: hypothetical protein GY738_18005, partial [Pseudoalteromonas sp.]|nr:hypothetical protein [Pseudoalteromonas sp.]
RVHQESLRKTLWKQTLARLKWFDYLSTRDDGYGLEQHIDLQQVPWSLWEFSLYNRDILDNFCDHLDVYSENHWNMKYEGVEPEPEEAERETVLIDKEDETIQVEPCESPQRARLESLTVYRDTPPALIRDTPAEQTQETDETQKDHGEPQGEPMDSDGRTTPSGQKRDSKGKPTTATQAATTTAGTPAGGGVVGEAAGGGSGQPPEKPVDYLKPKEPADAEPQEMEQQPSDMTLLNVTTVAHAQGERESPAERSASADDSAAAATTETPVKTVVTAGEP